MVPSYFSKKTRDFSCPDMDNHHPRSFSTTKSRYNIAEISTYTFIAMAQKLAYHVIDFWPKDFEKLGAQDQDHDKMDSDEFSKVTPDIAAIRLEDYDKFFNQIRRYHTLETS